MSETRRTGRSPLHLRKGETLAEMIERQRAPARSPEGWPSGWKLVPVEPTQEMVRAATVIAPTWDDDASRRKWNAMLSAAPAAPASGAEQELIAELEKTNNEIIASDGDTCEYTAMVRDVLAIARRSPSPSPPGWEEAREALLRASGALLALRSFQDSTWPAETAAKIYEDAARAQKQIAAALRALPAPSPAPTNPKRR